MIDGDDKKEAEGDITVTDGEVMLLENNVSKLSREDMFKILDDYGTLRKTGVLDDSATLRVFTESFFGSSDVMQMMVAANEVTFQLARRYKSIFYEVTS